MTAAIAKAGKRLAATTTGSQQSELASLMERHVNADGFHATAIPRLILIRAGEPSEPLPTVYDPALCLVAQGRKQVMLGNEVYFYDPEQYLVVTVDLPVVGQVIEASPEKPYLCLKLDLDAGQLSALMMELGQTPLATRNHGN